MHRIRRQTANGLYLLVIILLITGCASTQTATSKKRPETVVPKVEHAPDRAQRQEVSAQKVKRAEPLNSSLISSKFKQENTAARQEITVSLADIEFVEQRLWSYEKKFHQWLEITDKIQAGDDPTARPDDADCVQEFEKILAGYSLLFERMLHNKTVPLDKFHTVDPSRMQQLDIAFLESRCAELLGHDTIFADNFLTEAEEEPSFDQLTSDSCPGSSLPAPRSGAVVSSAR